MSVSALQSQEHVEQSTTIPQDRYETNLSVATRSACVRAVPIILLVTPGRLVSIRAIATPDEAISKGAFPSGR